MSITLIIIIITALVSYQCFNDHNLKSKLAHYPVAEAGNGEYHRLFTAGLVHADMNHLLINMFVLYFFGEAIENQFIYIFGPVLGMVHFVILYITAIVAANLTTYAKHKENPRYSAVGASGAISAVLFVFMMINPWSTIYLYFVIPIYAVLAGFLFLAWESYAGKKQIGRTDHDGHFYGALFGVVYIIAVKPSIFTAFIAELMNPPFL